MESRQNKIHKKHASNKKDKKIKTFSSCLQLNDNQSKEKYSKKNRVTQDYKNTKEKYNIKKIETTELGLGQKQKVFNQIIQSKLASSKSKSKNKNRKKYKKISSIDVINIHNSKKSSHQKIINHSQNKEEHTDNTILKKINNFSRPIGRSTNFEVFKIKNPKKNFNLTNLNINYQINNIKTIDTEKVHKSDANNNENKGVNFEINKNTENDDEKNMNKNEFKKITKYIPDEIEINTTNQETNYKSGTGKYLSMILFNIKKYKKLNQNYKKENEVLRKENDDLKNKMQDMNDELDIMKEEIELNKQNNKENENKFKELTEYIKQNEINYEQKIFNLKQLLFSKDQEINKLNKLIDNENIRNNKIIEELKLKISNQEKIIKDQQLIINQNKPNEE